MRRPLSLSPLYLSPVISRIYLLITYLFIYSDLLAILLELMSVYVYEKKKKRLDASVCVLFLCDPPALQQRESRGSVRLLGAAVLRDEKGLQGDDASAAPVARSHLRQRQLPGPRRGYRCGYVAHRGSLPCSLVLDFDCNDH